MALESILFDARGHPLWAVWYGVLWAAVIPFVVMLGWVLLYVTRERSGRESTWLNGAVLGAFFVLIVTSFVSALLYTRAQSDRTVWTYVGWLVVHFVGWTFLGSGVFFASLHALAAGPRLGMRRVAAVLAVLGVAILHFASLYATYAFRHR